MINIILAETVLGFTHTQRETAKAVARANKRYYVYFGAHEFVNTGGE